MTMANDEATAIGEVLGEQKIPPLRKDEVVLDVIVAVKVITEDVPRPYWVFRSTDGVTDVEALGALTMAAAQVKESLLDCYEDDDD